MKDLVTSSLFSTFVLVSIAFLLARIQVIEGGKRVGGWTEADTKSDEIVSLAQLGMEEMQQKSNGTQGNLRLLSIERARRKVVSGLKFEIWLFVDRTKCLKSDADFHDKIKCPGTAESQCEMKFFKNKDQQVKKQGFYCILKL